MSRETAEVPPLHPSVSGVSALLRVRALVLMTGGHVERRGGGESYSLARSDFDFVVFGRIKSDAKSISWLLPLLTWEK